MVIEDTLTENITDEFIKDLYVIKESLGYCEEEYIEPSSKEECRLDCFKYEWILGDNTYEWLFDNFELVSKIFEKHKISGQIVVYGRQAAQMEGLYFDKGLLLTVKPLIIWE